jgi:nucleoside recognition membrane protein YjiH
MPFSTLVGSLGVSLLLVAFFANLFGWLRASSYPYILLNVAGGALSAYASWLIDYLPFVVLEGTWAAVAAAALVRRIARGPAAAPPAG